jgi:hypothetical protein
MFLHMDQLVPRPVLPLVLLLPGLGSLALDAPEILMIRKSVEFPLNPG